MSETMETVVWVLSEYEYNSYSYSEIEVNRSHIHASEAGAREHASRLGLTIRSYCQDPETDATLEKQILLP